MRSRNLQENSNRKAAARPGGGDADAIDNGRCPGANVGNFGGLTKKFRSNCKKFLLIKKFFLPLHRKQGRPDSRNIKKRKKMRKSEIEALIKEQKEKMEKQLATCDNPYTIKFYQGLIAGYDYAISLLNI